MITDDQIMGFTWDLVEESLPTDEHRKKARRQLSDALAKKIKPTVAPGGVDLSRLRPEADKQQPKSAALQVPKRKD